MPKKQDNIVNSLAHTQWNCKYHIVFAPKYRRKFFMRKKIGDKGYYVDTVGKNTTAIKEYIANQLERDREMDQLVLFDPKDPFMGSK